ncbi:hypothetical protein DFH27DRAFT_115783 [Peziza echinospora]|nr:hypothetical protein DFH27DRAFT_115783 [Peziza echinospora]
MDGREGRAQHGPRGPRPEDQRPEDQRPEDQGQRPGQPTGLCPSHPELYRLAAHPAHLCRPACLRRQLPMAGDGHCRDGGYLMYEYVIMTLASLPTLPALSVSLLTHCRVYRIDAPPSALASRCRGCHEAVAVVAVVSVAAATLQALGSRTMPCRHDSHQSRRPGSKHHHHRTPAPHVPFTCAHRPPRVGAPAGRRIDDPPQTCRAYLCLEVGAGAG